MVDTTMHRGRPALRTSYTVKRMTNPEEIRRILGPEAAYAAYALAQLEPGLFEQSRWYMASSPSGQALVMHSSGGLGPAMFTFGEPEALDIALGLHPGPHFTFGSLRPEHRRVVEKHFLVTRKQTMLRMAVTAESFVPVEGKTIRLTGRDIARINQLYASDGGTTRYSARHIDEGIYFGAAADGKLAAIAGTHAVSRREGVAVVGNVFTHPDYRNRRLATLTTSAVTQVLLAMCPFVVLTVEAENAPAVRVYRNLGYHPEGALHETPLIRKEPLGLLSLMKRLVAAWRGREEGMEVVVR